MSETNKTEEIQNKLQMKEKQKKKYIMSSLISCL